MGYSAEMSVERGYRDSRINRIFEGTNEINRLLVVDTAMKRAMKGDFDLFGKADALIADIDNLTDHKKEGESWFEEKLRNIRNFKNLILIVLQGASKHFDKKLVTEQEVLNNLTDMIMETYLAESLALRIRKMESLNGTAQTDVYHKILDTFVYDAADKIRKSAFDAINSYANPSVASKFTDAANILTKVTAVNVKEARRSIAEKLIEDNHYKF